jgi:hypothetical protein
MGERITGNNKRRTRKKRVLTKALIWQQLNDHQ